MKELTSFIIKAITDNDNFSVDTKEDGDRVVVDVIADKSIIGLLIGKEGKTIKNIRRILSILATKENKVVSINVIEQG